MLPSWDFFFLVRTPMQRTLALAGMAALVLAACSDDPTGLQDNATAEDR